MIFRRIPCFAPDDNRLSGEGGGGDGGEDAQSRKEAVPDIPIVRSNTPKPVTLGTSPGAPSHWLRHEEQTPFPARAPSAPPVPEETSEPDPAAVNETPLPGRPSLPVREQQEFLWVFEYGLEMDPALLNSPERLDGLALLYGSAMLKGYRVAIGSVKPPNDGSREQTIVTIVPVQEGKTEVWGVLYRVPRRVAERLGDEQPLLDTIHAATPAQDLFRSIQVVVRETYRDSELIGVVTYIAADKILQQLAQGSGQQATGVMLERLLAIARKQKLPESYLRALSVQVASDTKPITPTPLPVEQHTDPLPVLRAAEQEEKQIVNKRQRVPARPANRWLMAFAIYLVCLLVCLLVFAVVEGSGVVSWIFNASFTPLHVPWLVLVYGLLGGCISCIVTLGRGQPLNRPNFIIVTWFARPFIGAVLALFAYLLLNCGLFILSDNAEVRSTLFMLAGALAGICEGWLFTRRR